jgi:uncharacterized protein YjiS (DUF1127 family)
MSDIASFVRGPSRASPAGTLAGRIGAIGALAHAQIREWRRRCRSRWELASYSFDQRRDFGFAADLDAEIAKPFWKT